MKRLSARIHRSFRGEAGLTLIELLVSSAMGVVLMGAVGTMVVQTMRAQPEVSNRSQNITTARWVLERMTREIRNGATVDTALPNEVSFRTYLRRTECGKTGTLASTTPAILCEVTYGCSTTACTRIEAAPGVTTGTAKPIFEGIDDSSVFSYKPSAEAATFIGITLHLPNPSGPSDLTISDGASLRNAILAN
jgi:type II secretory pathway pseudopilin PulG